jgi:hypothetical protein
MIPSLAVLAESAVADGPYRADVSTRQGAYNCILRES